jgi:polygalacturonase
MFPTPPVLLLANLAWASAAVATIVAEGAAGEDHRPSRYTQQQNSLVQIARSESVLQHSMTSQQQQQQQQEHRGGALFESCESVSAHGAKGDGVTDDTAAFQAAAAVVVRNAEVVIPAIPLSNSRSIALHSLA